MLEIIIVRGRDRKSCLYEQKCDSKAYIVYKVSQKSKVFERFRSSDKDYVTITWERNVHIKRKSKNKLESLSPIS